MDTATNKSAQNQQARQSEVPVDNAQTPELPKVQFSETAPTADTSADTKIDVRNVNFYYGAKQALFDVSLPIREHQVTALIGPSGCGKSTFLRTLNRMNDLIPKTRIEGTALLDGQNIYEKGLDVVLLRQRIGMVFQRPNPFPK